MLIELYADNIAIMDRAEVRFGPGFTAITGETGAGKSLLIDAISLCLGERADTSLVRKGASSASVRAVFDAPPQTRALLEELGYPIGNDALYLQRDLAVEGKSICRINGKAAPLSVLKQVGDSLADLHGQHEHQSLLHTGNHLTMLDDWIGEVAHSARAATTQHWELISQLRSEKELLQRDSSERERMLDVLRFQVDEIDRAEVRAGEIAELQLNLKRMQGAEALEEALASSEESLFVAEVSARERIQTALHSVSTAADLDPTLADSVEALRAAELSLEAAIHGIKAARDAMEFDPEKIELIAARLDEYASLRRKYGETEQQILDFLEKAGADLHRLEHADQLSSDIESRLSLAQDAYEVAARRLTETRQKNSKEFAEQVQRELRDLGMAQAKFVCRIEESAPWKNGADHFEFLFSANAGEDAKPLTKIASGGEMSRLMLAIKTVMAGKGGVPTLIFDEIDAGLGGQTASVVAKKLSRLGEDYQVIVISHVVQIAGKASAQVSITKDVIDGRTVTTVRELSPDERVEEIARMVGGEKVSDAAIENARQLLID